MEALASWGLSAWTIAHSARRRNWEKRDIGNIVRLPDPPDRQSFLSEAALCFVGHEIIRRFARGATRL